MALADIIRKIETDTAEEVAAIAAAAASRVAAIDEDAEKRAREHTESVTAVAERNAQREVATLVANASLTARDATVTAKRILLDEALGLAREELTNLPREQYVGFLAQRVAEQAKGGETLSFGSADSDIAEKVSDAIAAAAPDLGLKLSGRAASFERGALLEGDRVRANVSLEAIIEDHRDELEVVASQVLFGEGE